MCGNRWYLAVIAAWGPALLGAVGLFAKLRAGGNYPKSSFLVLTLCAAPLVSLAGGFAGRVMGRRKRSSDGPVGQIDDRIELPVSDERVFEIARWALSQNPLKPVARQFDPGVAMRIGSCHAKRRTGDDAIIGFVVTVMVDPRLGVPCTDPTAEPSWGSSTVLVIHLDENGRPLNGSPK